MAAPTRLPALPVSLADSSEAHLPKMANLLNLLVCVRRLAILSPAPHFNEHETLTPVPLPTGAAQSQGAQQGHRR